MDAAPLGFIPNAFGTVLNECWNADMAAMKHSRVHAYRGDVAGRARPRICHVDTSTSYLFKGNAVAGMSWRCNKCLDLSKIELDIRIHLRIGIGIYEKFPYRLPCHPSPFGQ